MAQLYESYLFAYDMVQIEEYIISNCIVFRGERHIEAPNVSSGLGARLGAGFIDARSGLSRKHI